MLNLNDNNNNKSNKKIAKNFTLNKTTVQFFYFRDKVKDRRPMPSSGKSTLQSGHQGSLLGRLIQVRVKHHALTIAAKPV